MGNMKFESWWLITWVSQFFSYRWAQNKYGRLIQSLIKSLAELRWKSTGVNTRVREKRGTNLLYTQWGEPVIHFWNSREPVVVLRQLVFVNRFHFILDYQAVCCCLLSMWRFPCKSFNCSEVGLKLVGFLHQLLAHFKVSKSHMDEFFSSSDPVTPTVRSLVLKKLINKRFAATQKLC